MSTARYYLDDFGRPFAHVEQASRKWQHMEQVPLPPGLKNVGVDELWENEWYSVTVRRFESGFFIKKCAYVRLGIANMDQSASHDWRDFQQIKNDICGRDWEGFEMYPRESVLVDTSNQFILWCVPGGTLKIPHAFKRNILKSSEAMAPQRPFANEKG